MPVFSTLTRALLRASTEQTIDIDIVIVIVTDGC